MLCREKSPGTTIYESLILIRPVFSIEVGEICLPVITYRKEKIYCVPQMKGCISYTNESRESTA